MPILIDINLFTWYHGQYINLNLNNQEKELNNMSFKNSCSQVKLIITFPFTFFIK